MTSDLLRQVHDHDFLELFWVEAGKGWHGLNGRRLELVPGSCFLVRETDEHALASAGGGGLSFVNVAFPTEVWIQLRKRYFADQPDFFRLPAGQRMRCLSPEGVMDLEWAVSEMAGGKRDRRAIDRFLLNFFHAYERTTDGRGGIPSWLEKACREIQKPEFFVKGTPAFARLSGRVPPHVARAAKRFLGKTPTELVNDARMAHAARRLMEDAKILDVLTETGFRSLGHFYRVFTRHFDVSPREYRLRQRQAFAIQNLDFFADYAAKKKAVRL